MLFDWLISLSYTWQWLTWTLRLVAEVALTCNLFIRSEQTHLKYTTVHFQCIHTQQVQRFYRHFFFKGETDLWMLAWFSIYWADGNVFSYIYEMLFIVPLTGCVGTCVRVFAELIPGKMHFGLWNPCVSNLWAARVVNFRLWTTWHWTRRTLRFLIQRKKKKMKSSIDLFHDDDVKWCF